MHERVMRRPSPTRWGVLVVVLLSSTVGVLPGFLLGALAVQVQADLAFGPGVLGAVVAVFFAAAAVCSTPAGRVADRFGAPVALRCGALVAGAAMVAVAVAGRSPAVLALILALGGSANAFCQVGSNTLLAQAIRPGRQGLAFAVKQSAIPAATLLGGLAVPLVALTVGWRWAFVGGALLAAVALAVVPPGRPSNPGPSPGRRPPLHPLFVLALGAGFGAAAGSAIGAFLVAAAVTTVSLSERTAGLLLAGCSVLIIAARLGAGLLADRRGRGFLPLVAGMLTVGAAGFLLLGSTSAAVFVTGAVLASVAGWGWPGLFNFAVVAHDRSAAARSTGITQTGVSAGAASGPLLLGVTAQQLSFPVAWGLAALLAVLAAVAMLLGHVGLRRRT